MRRNTGRYCVVQTRQLNQTYPMIRFTNSLKRINAPELNMFMAHDDDDGNDEFENNSDRRELLVMFDENKVVKSIKQSKSNKSPGPDLPINELFIHGQNVLVKHCTILFNKIFDESGHLPTCWSKGIILPIQKKVRYIR